MAWIFCKGTFALINKLLNQCRQERKVILCSRRFWSVIPILRIALSDDLMKTVGSTDFSGTRSAKKGKLSGLSGSRFIEVSSARTEFTESEIKIIRALPVSVVSFNPNLRAHDRYTLIYPSLRLTSERTIACISPILRQVEQARRLPAYPLNSSLSG